MNEWHKMNVMFENKKRLMWNIVVVLSYHFSKKKVNYVETFCCILTYDFLNVKSYISYKDAEEKAKEIIQSGVTNYINTLKKDLSILNIVTDESNLLSELENDELRSKQLVIEYFS